MFQKKVCPVQMACQMQDVSLSCLVYVHWKILLSDDLMTASFQSYRKVLLLATDGTMFQTVL